MKDKLQVVRKALHYAKTPMMIAMVVTPLRFSLEVAGIPEVYIFLIGLLWLTLGFAVYWGIRMIDEKEPFMLLLVSLMLFSPVSRIPVFILWWITKTWELGTHYDIFDNWTQALVGQLFYGSLVQIIPGFMVGSIVLFIMKSRTRYSTN